MTQASGREKRIAANVKGRVQGVGFRYYTHDIAQDLGLSGWVRNLPNGNVELEAQGPADKIDTFIARLRQGPPLSHVNDVQINELPAEPGSSGFDVRY